MVFINSFVEISVILLSITTSLSAHTLPTESISPRAVTPEAQGGLTYQFEFQNEQGKRLSKEDAAGIKVFHYNHHHHANNSAKTSNLQKRAASRAIDQNYCRQWGDEFFQSECNATSPRAWNIECVAPVIPGPYGWYTDYGACQDWEICIDRFGGHETAYCVSQDLFIEIALYPTTGNNKQFHQHVAELPAQSVIRLHATDPMSMAGIKLHHLEVHAQKCVRAIGNVEQCSEVQSAACENCQTDVLSLTRGGANRLSFLVRFFRPSINLYLDVYHAKF